MKIINANFRLIIGSSIVGSLFWSSAVFAQGTSEQRSACMGDAFRFCGADIPNVSKIEACLSQNRAGITPACAAEFQPAQKTLLKPEHFRKN